MKKVLVIGSLNMDMVVSVKSIPRAGETVLASLVQKYSGGKGANQAVACSKFEAETSIIGAVGNDEDGELLLKNIKANGVDISGIKIHSSERTGMAWITVDSKGENSIVVVPGSNRCLSKEDIDANEALFKEADVILLQLEIPEETVAYAIKIGEENGCKIILNPAPAVKLDPDILNKIDLITPNESELDILTMGMEQGNLVKKAQKLLELGVRNVICTLGEKGVLLVNRSGHTEFPAYLVEAVDTTGAGDCFNGVLAAELAGNKSIEEAIKSAVEASAISVTKKGAQASMPSRQDVEIYKKNLQGVTK